MNERLLQFVKRKNLTSAKLAEILEVQSSSISHILGGRNKPSYDFIAKFLDKFPDVSPQWLILGNGEMFIDTEPKLKMQTTISENSLFDSPEPATRINTPRLSQPAAEDMIETDDIFQSRVTPITNNSKGIERIIIFYKDKSFSEYFPE